MTLNGRPERVLSDSEPSAVKWRTHRRTVVRACPVCRTIALIDLPCRCSCTSSERCCAVRRTMANQSKYRQWQRASGSSRIVAVAHTTMSVGMDNTTKTINQPLVRKRSNTTLGEGGGKVGILSKPAARKQTHTLPAQGNRNPCWTFHTGHSEEDYIGHLPNPVHSTAFKHKQITNYPIVTYLTPCTCTHTYTFVYTHTHVYTFFPYIHIYIFP